MNDKKSANTKQDTTRKTHQKITIIENAVIYQSMFFFKYFCKENNESAM